METGGHAAARGFLASTERPTAVMVATDRNALGLMSVLKNAGMTLPDDLAIVAFDNIESAAFSVPSLTSTSQRFDELGSLAGHLILAAIRGDEVPHRVFTPKTVAIKVRTSCGCSDGESLGERPTGDAHATTAHHRGLAERGNDLCTVLATADEVLNGPARDAELAAIAATERLLTLGRPVTDADMRALTLSLRSLTSDPDSVHRIIDAVIEHTERITTPGIDATALSRVNVELWKIKAGARRFAPDAITTAQLAALVHAATRGVPADVVPTPDLYLIVHAVDGLAPGTYAARADGRALASLRAAELRREAGFLGLGQTLPAEAAVNLYWLMDLEPVFARYGGRGYRAAQLMAAIAGGRTYLAAYAQGLGATGLTFFDDAVTAFFSPHAAGKSVLFLMAVGRRARRPA
jgi:hypothetical protein